MTSGFGAAGSVGRCFDIYHDFEECVNAPETYSSIQCSAFREDYIECLHHKKENARDIQFMKAKKAGEAAERKGKKWKDL